MGGGTPSKSEEKYWNGSIPWISSSDMTEDSVTRINISRYINYNAIDNSATKLCPENTIHIVSRVGVGKVAISHMPLCTSQDFTNFISNDLNDRLFLTYYLSVIMKKKSQQTQGTSIKGITSEEIKKLRVYLPSLLEQEKIANFLSLVDERIEQQRQLVEALKRYKRGLFLRLYDDCDKKEYKISEIGKYCSTGTLSKDDVDEFGKYPCILYGELFTKYNEIIKQVSSSTNITPTYLSGNNEVLFPSSTTADALSLIFPSSLKIENIFLGGDLFVIKLYGKFDSDFISYLLNYVYKTKLARYTQGITIIHLHYTDIKDQILDIPDINTQHKVAGIVNIIDMLIDKHTDKLNAQIELKKGFLQQMFI